MKLFHYICKHQTTFKNLTYKLFRFSLASMNPATFLCSRNEIRTYFFSFTSTRNKTEANSVFGNTVASLKSKIRDTMENFDNLGFKPAICYRFFIFSMSKIMALYMYCTEWTALLWQKHWLILDFSLTHYIIIIWREEERSDFAHLIWTQGWVFLVIAFHCNSPCFALLTFSHHKK